MDRLVRTGRDVRTGQKRPGHRQAEENDAQGAQGHENEIAEPQPAATAAYGMAKEVHCRPIDDAVPLAMQQVDRHRPCGQEQSRDGEPGGKEHGRSPWRAASAAEDALGFWPWRAEERAADHGLAPNWVRRVSILPS